MENIHTVVVITVAPVSCNKHTHKQSFTVYEMGVQVAMHIDKHDIESLQLMNAFS